MCASFLWFKSHRRDVNGLSGSLHYRVLNLGTRISCNGQKDGWPLFQRERTVSVCQCCSLDKHPQRDYPQEKTVNARRNARDLWRKVSQQTVYMVCGQA